MRQNGVPRDEQVKEAFHCAVDTSTQVVGIRVWMLAVELRGGG
jgi:hypothetical protein